MKFVVPTHKEVFSEWARAKMPHCQTWGEHLHIGLIDDTGKILAVVIYNDFVVEGCSIHIASEGKGWLNRQFLKAAFEYPFIQLGFNRLTGFVPAKNTSARKLDEHLGFIYEGTMRNALPDDDIIVYGMLKKECRFLEMK